MLWIKEETETSHEICSFSKVLGWRRGSQRYSFQSLSLALILRNSFLSGSVNPGRGIPRGYIFLLQCTYRVQDRYLLFWLFGWDPLCLSFSKHRDIFCTWTHFFQTCRQWRSSHWAQFRCSNMWECLLVFLLASHCPCRTSGPSVGLVSYPPIPYDCLSNFKHLWWH